MNAMIRRAMIPLLALSSTSACDILEDDFNYIIVNCNVEIHTWFSDNTPAPNEPVEVTIVKDGGQRVEEDVMTNSDGWTSVHASFNLYKEQPIVAYARIVDGAASAEKTLTWEVADQEAAIPTDKSPRKYTWNTVLSLVIKG